MLSLSFLFKKFIEVQLIYNVMLVSGDSKVIQLYTCVCVCVCILFQIFLLYRLLQDID